MVIFSLENKFLRRWLWQKWLEFWLWCLEMFSIQIMMGMIQLLSILMVNTLILLLPEYCYLPAAGCSSGQHQQDWYYSDKLLICSCWRLATTHTLLWSETVGREKEGEKLSIIIIRRLSSCLIILSRPWWCGGLQVCVSLLCWDIEAGGW